MNNDAFVFYSRLHNEDADPYIGGNILAVADGLGGSGSTVHKVGSTKKWAKSVKSENAEFDLQGNMIYKELLNGVFDCNLDGSSEDNEFISYIKELCEPMADETDDTSALWASRIVIARFVYALRFGKFKDCDLESIEKRKELVSYITDGLEIAAKKFDLKKGELDQQYLLPTTLAAVRYTELKDKVIAEAVWAGDSRCYALTPQKGLQLLTADNEDRSGAINNLFYVKDKGKDPTVLHYARHEIEKPCVLIAASDGCFDPFGEYDNLGLEATLLSHLRVSSSATDCAYALDEYFAGMRYDDTSMAFVPFGFDEADRQSRDSKTSLDSIMRDGQEIKGLCKGIDTTLKQWDEPYEKRKNVSQIYGADSYKQTTDDTYKSMCAAFAARAKYAEKLWSDINQKKSLIEVSEKSEDDAYAYIRSRLSDKFDKAFDTLYTIYVGGNSDIALTTAVRDVFKKARSDAENTLKQQSEQELETRMSALFDDVIGNKIDDLTKLIKSSTAVDQHIDIIEKNERDILKCVEAAENLHVALYNITELENEEKRLLAKKKELQEYALDKRRETDDEFDRLRNEDYRAALKMSNINKEWQNFCAILSENTSIPPREYLRGALEGDPFISLYNAWSKEYNEICKNFRVNENSDYVKKQIKNVKEKKADCEKNIRSAKEKLAYHIKKKISSDPAKLVEIFTDAAISVYGLVADRPDNTYIDDIVSDKATRLPAAQKSSLVNFIVQGLAQCSDKTSAIDGLFNSTQLKEFRAYCMFKCDKNASDDVNGLLGKLRLYDDNCAALVSELMSAEKSANKAQEQKQTESSPSYSCCSQGVIKRKRAKNIARADKLGSGYKKTVVKR